MSAEQATGLIVAVTGLVGALGILVVQLAAVRKQIDGRLTELLAKTELAALKDGELLGRDHSRGGLSPVPTGAVSLAGGFPSPPLSGSPPSTDDTSDRSAPST